MRPDEELVGAVGRGEGDALRELCRRHDRSLHGFLWRYTGGRDVDDLRQETWMRVVRAAPRFDATKRFRPWLYRIALNLARDWHRRPPDEPVGDVADELGGGTTLDATEAAVDVRRLLAELPEAQRAVVLLRHYHDLPEDDVAEILDVPKGTVKSRLHNAMARLAERARKTTA